MASGIYAAAAGMAAQQTQLDAIANDLANVDTSGYRSERVGFEDLLYSSEDGVSVGGGAGAVDAGATSGAGAIAPSTNPLAVALSGPGFLQVRGPGGGVALTRDGNLQLDAKGELVTDLGATMVPPITVPAGTSPSAISIGADGSVSVAGKTIGRLQIVNVPASTGLQAVGGNLYVPTTASGAPAPVSGTTLQQGMLEGSNVDVAQEMSAMVNAQNNYSLLSRVLTTQDQMAEMANELRQ